MVGGASAGESSRKAVTWARRGALGANTIYAVVVMAVSARLGDEPGQSIEQLEQGHPLAVLRQGHKAARWVQNAIQPYHMAILLNNRLALLSCKAWMPRSTGRAE